MSMVTTQISFFLHQPDFRFLSSAIKLFSDRTQFPLDTGSYLSGHEIRHIFYDFFKCNCFQFVFECFFYFIKPGVECGVYIAPHRAFGIGEIMKMKESCLIYTLHSLVDIEKRYFPGERERTEPPLPRWIVTIPALFSCPRILRTITGFTLVLPARNSLVTFTFSPKIWIQMRMCTESVNRDEICMEPF